MPLQLGHQISSLFPPRYFAIVLPFTWLCALDSFECPTEGVGHCPTFSSSLAARARRSWQEFSSWRRSGGSDAVACRGGPRAETESKTESLFPNLCLGCSWETSSAARHCRKEAGAGWKNMAMRTGIQFCLGKSYRSGGRNVLKKQGENGGGPEGQAS